jgi:hypothetical protein
MLLGSTYYETHKGERWEKIVRVFLLSVSIIKGKRILYKISHHLSCTFEIGHSSMANFHGTQIENPFIE